ncbi:MAG: hypothetical protein RL660_3122 [Bacteroidota bacterium]|jgi:hypothetical protein
MIKTSTIRLVLTCFCAAIVAQCAGQSAILHKLNNYPYKTRFAEPMPNPNAKLRKTRFTPFYTETFGTYTGAGASAVPTGWTAVSTNGNGTWQWTNQATSGAFNVGTIASTSSADGWILYNSDSIGNVSGFPQGALGPAGHITSPTIDCSGHSSVMIRFMQLYAKFADSTFVDVSNNNGATWTSYLIQSNRLMPNNLMTSNPQIIKLNISSVAANSSTVRVRFRYNCNYYLGGYNWLIDDVELGELDPYDIEVAHLSPHYTEGFGGRESVFSSIPFQLEPPFYLNFETSSFGSISLPTQDYFLKTYNLGNGILVNNQTVTEAMPTGTEGKYTGGINPMQFSKQEYATFLTSPLIGDPTPTNNNDTMIFEITDDRFSQATGLRGAVFALNRPAGIFDAVKQLGGVLYLIPNGKSDTFTHAEVVIAPNTDVGTQIIADVYKVDFNNTNNEFIKIATSDPVTLTAAEISTNPSNLKTAKLKFPYNNINGNTTVAEGGLYLVSVRGYNTTATQTIELYTSEKPFPTMLLGIGGDLDNNAPLSLNTAFNAGIMIPMVDWIFTKNVDVTEGFLGVSNLQTQFCQIVPNPSTTYVQLQLSNNSNDMLTIQLYDMAGRVVLTTSAKHNDFIDIASIAPGAYNMVVSKGAQRQNLKLIKQ